MFTLNSLSQILNYSRSFLTKINFLQPELFICHGFLRQSSLSFVKDHVEFQAEAADIYYKKYDTEC